MSMPYKHLKMVSTTLAVMYNSDNHKYNRVIDMYLYCLPLPRFGITVTGNTIV